jgi:hypothetical protein
MVDDVRLTQQGVVAGTPEYMAPEQARGEALDHRADLFSLGSVLYAMSTGSPPFRGETVLAVLRQVSDEVPLPVRAVNPQVPAWLELLVARLQAKNPADRFQSASEVAALLEGYLAHLGQPTTMPAPAIIPPPEYPCLELSSLSAKCPTRRLVLGVAALSLVALGVWLVHGTSASLRTVPLDPQTSREPSAGPVVRRLRGHTGAVHHVAFGPYGQLVSASGGPAGERTLRIWDTATGHERLRFSTSDAVRALDVSFDGCFALLGLQDGEVLRLDLEARRPVLHLPGHTGVVSWVAFTPDGMHAFSAAGDGTARYWDLGDRHEIRRFHCLNQSVRAGALSPDSRRLLTGDSGGVLQVWDVQTGAEVKRIERLAGAINGLRVTTDGRQVLIAHREAALYDLETGHLLRTFEGPGGDVSQAVPSPDGRWLLTASHDGAVRLWDFRTGNLLRCLGSHEGVVLSVAFSPDGRFAASAGSDHDIRLWDLMRGETPHVRKSP